MKCLILAAGLGTRLRPLTDSIPKALVPISGRPLLTYIIEKLKTEGAKEIVINVHHFAEQIIDFLSEHNFNIPIKISDERSQLLDTGGALRKALSLFSDQTSPILVHNVDILSNAPLHTLYESNKEFDATLLVSSRPSNRQLYFDKANNLIGWQNLETKEIKPNNIVFDNNLKGYAFSGIHLISPRLLPVLNTFPERFSIIDFYLSTCHQYTFKGVVQADLALLDVGKIDSIQKAETFLSKII